MASGHLPQVAELPGLSRRTNVHRFQKSDLCETDAGNAEKKDEKSGDAAPRTHQRRPKPTKYGDQHEALLMRWESLVPSVWLLGQPGSSRTDAYGNLTSSATLDKAGMATPWDNKLMGGSGVGFTLIIPSV